MKIGANGSKIPEISQEVTTPLRKQCSSFLVDKDPGGTIGLRSRWSQSPLPRICMYKFFLLNILTDAKRQGSGIHLPLGTVNDTMTTFTLKNVNSTKMYGSAQFLSTQN